VIARGVKNYLERGAGFFPPDYGSSPFPTLSLTSSALGVSPFARGVGCLDTGAYDGVSLILSATSPS